MLDFEIYVLKRFDVSLQSILTSSWHWMPSHVSISILIYFILVWPVPLSSTDFSFQTWVLEIYLNFQQEKWVETQSLPHSESKSYKINSIKSCSSRSFQQHQWHIPNSSQIFSQEIIQYSRTFAPQVQTQWNQAHGHLLVKNFRQTPRSWSEASRFGGAHKYKKHPKTTPATHILWVWCLRGEQLRWYVCKTWECSEYVWQDAVSGCSQLEHHDSGTCHVWAKAEGTGTIWTNATRGCATQLRYLCGGAECICRYICTGRRQVCSLADHSKRMGFRCLCRE